MKCRVQVDPHFALKVGIPFHIPKFWSAIEDEIFLYNSYIFVGKNAQPAIFSKFT